MVHVDSQGPKPSDSEKGGSLAASYVEFVLAEAAALRRSAFVTYGIRALPWDKIDTALKTFEKMPPG
jgi:hypothetical protein